MINYEKAELDLDWIENALAHPTYLEVKGDRSNMFELSDDSEGYIRYIKEELERKGYSVSLCGRYIGVKK